MCYSVFCFKDPIAPKSLALFLSAQRYYYFFDLQKIVILSRPQAGVRIYFLGWWARTAACQVEESMWV